MALTRTIIICANSSWNLVNYRSGLIRALIAGGDTVIALAPRDASTGAVEALGCRFIELPMNPSGTECFFQSQIVAALFRHFAPRTPRLFSWVYDQAQYFLGRLPHGC